MSELSKANPFKTAAHSARGAVVVSRTPTMATRGRSGGWMLKPKSSVDLLDESGNRVSRTVIGGGLTQGGKTLVAAGGAGGVMAGAHLHGKRYARRDKTRTVKVKIKKGAPVPEVSESAFGQEIAKAFPGAIGQSAMKAAKPRVAGMRNQAKATLKPLGTSAMGGASAFGAKAKKGFGQLSPNQKLGAAAGAGAIGGAGVGLGMNRKKF